MTIVPDLALALAKVRKSCLVILLQLLRRDPSRQDYSTDVGASLRRLIVSLGDKVQCNLLNHGPTTRSWCFAAVRAFVARQILLALKIRFGGIFLSGAR
jgi:hypothetical protein